MQMGVKSSYNKANMLAHVTSDVLRSIAVANSGVECYSRGEKRG